MSSRRDVARANLNRAGEAHVNRLAFDRTRLHTLWPGTTLDDASELTETSEVVLVTG